MLGALDPVVLARALLGAVEARLRTVETRLGAMEGAIGALVVGWSTFVHPVYTPRYLAFTAPALALVLGICIATIAPRRWVAAALVPSFASGLMFNWAADVVALVAVLGAARALLALAGMDVGTSFGGIGSSREMMIATLAEPAMMLIVVTLAIAAGTTRLAGVADFFIAEPFAVRVSLALSLISLVIVALAENARIPVDNPTTHLELTMVHEAMVLEYSGRHLALIEAASHLKLVLYLSLLICLFAPFGMAPATAGLSGWAIGLVAWIAKLLAGAVLLGVWEVSIAKMRVFRLPDYVGVAFVFGFIAILLAFLTRGVFA